MTIQEKLDELEKSIIVHKEYIVNLKDKLECLLVSDNPRPETEEENVLSEMSQVNTHIQNLNKQICECNYMLENIIGRLQV